MTLDQLPHGWRVVPLEDIAARTPNAIVDGPFGSNLKTTDYVDSGIPVLQGRNVTGDSFNWSEVRFITEKKAEELNRSSVRVNDILLVKIGSIGYSAIIDTLHGYDKAIIPANLAKVTPNAELVNTQYLHFWLTSQEAKRYFVSVASKTAQPALSLGKIKKLPVPLPPLQEQERIAAVLRKCSTVRGKRIDALAEIELLTRSIFLEMFGEPVQNTKRWKTVEFDRFFLDRTSSCYKLPTSGYQANGKFPVVDQGQSFIVGFNDDEKLLCPVELPVTVFGDHTRIIKHINFPFIVGADGAKVLKVVEGVNPRFATYLLKSLPIPDLGYSRHMKEVRRLSFIVPPVELQNEFERKVQAVDRVKQRMSLGLMENESLLSALRLHAFRGMI